MKRLIVLLVAFLITLPTQAITHSSSNQKWYGPFTVKKSAFFWDGAPNAVIHVNEEMNTGCGVTDTERKVTYRGSASERDWPARTYSIAVTAQASNKKIMLLIDGACRATYGLNVHGVEVLSD
ncbi:MAG: hypothetical protein JKY55_13985 [Aliivibrio sp.]|uniref:hypothetical protein n=1 Tax=Aliivibrio sp. TaxID=1872443 RepID=UPI001A5C4897|nr:hypothetical protein [Aliivibrio sp.]